MRDNLTKPCAACPFKRDSLAGWLGPWEPNELLQSIHHYPFPCHCTIKGDMDFDDPRMAKAELCAGAALFLNNRLTRSRDARTTAHQEKLGKDDSVFASDAEFREHHGNAPIKSWEF